jgi:hypothetical protein
MRENREISWLLAVTESQPQGEGQGQNPEMNDHEKSHVPIVPTKLRNKAAKAGADGVEGRGATKGNLIGQNARRTQSRGSAPNALDRCGKQQSASTPTPSGRTGCGNSARPGLCGGHPATGVPTASDEKSPAYRSELLRSSGDSSPRSTAHTHPAAPAVPPARNDSQQP